MNKLSSFLENVGMNDTNSLNTLTRTISGSINGRVHRIMAVQFPEMGDRRYYYMDFTILKELVMDGIIDPDIGTRESKRILEGGEGTRLDKKLEKMWLGHNAEKAVQNALLINKIPNNGE